MPEDLPSLRALIWKINFKYLPKNIKKWDDTFKEMRSQYKEIKEAYILRQREEIKILEEIENKINVKKDNDNINTKKNNIIKKSCNIEIENENKEKLIKKFQNQLFTPKKIALAETKETEVESRRMRCDEVS